MLRILFDSVNMKTVGTKAVHPFCHPGVSRAYLLAISETPF